MIIKVNLSLPIEKKEHVSLIIKVDVTTNIIYRAKLISSSDTLSYGELSSIKQTLINNNIPTDDFGKEIRLDLKKF